MCVRFLKDLLNKKAFRIYLTKSLKARIYLSRLTAGHRSGSKGLRRGGLGPLLIGEGLVIGYPRDSNSPTLISAQKVFNAINIFQI